MIITILIIVGLVGVVWDSLRQRPTEAGELAERYNALDAKHHQALKMLGGMMTATSLIRNQLAPVGTSVKSFEYVRITYYIHTDFSAEVIRAYGIRTPREPLHFWTTGFRATSHADAADYLEDIAFQAKDENGRKLAYLPITNDQRAKDVVVYFLPKIEPGETEARHVEMTFSWPRYLKQIGSEGSETFSYTLQSVDAIPTLEFYYFLQPGTGKKLVGEISNPRQAGDHLNPAASATYLGKEWSGFSCKVNNGPAGTFKYELRARLETP